jgi:putative transcriptional regulator
VVALLVLCAAKGGDDEGRSAIPAERFLAGQLLVATQTMSDPRFAGTVIYMVKHDSQGALGLIVNRLLGVGPVADLLQGLGVAEADVDVDGEIRILYGGPVQLEFGFVLHSTDYVGENTQIVNGQVAFTTSLDVLRDIAGGDGPKESLFALGYAGWAPGQLESEIAAKAWFSVPADQELIFGDDLEGKWDRAVAKRGLDL